MFKKYSILGIVPRISSVLIGRSKSGQAAVHRAQIASQASKTGGFHRFPAGKKQRDDGLNHQNAKESGNMMGIWNMMGR